MSRFRFVIPSVDEAIAMLAMDTRQAEFFADRVIALRRLMPVTRAAERAASKAFVLAPSTSCTSCGRFAFSQPTQCYWCRTGTRTV